LTPLIEHFARLHQVEPELVAAVVAVESGFNTAAVSPAGASGAMQLMPATAARYGVTNAADPAQNIDAGVRHLKDLLRLHGGNVALALAAYNAGQGAVARNGGRIPPYRETMLYVPAVLAAAARGAGLVSRTQHFQTTECTALLGGQSRRAPQAPASPCSNCSWW
jgi:soluble lytic murein transglycosylase-like protein